MWEATFSASNPGPSPSPSPSPNPTLTRRSLQTPELRKIVEKADPSGTGVITLEGLRRVLSDLGSEQAAEHGALTAASSGGVGGDL